MAVKAPEKKTVLESMNLALDHARGLLRDARVLLAHRRANSAYALAVLSLEEAGRVLYLAIVPDVRRCRNLFASHPDALRLVLTPDWKGVFRVRHHKWPVLDDTSLRRRRRAVRELARAVGRGRKGGTPFSVRELLRLRQHCLRSDIAEISRALWPNGLPRRVASACITVIDSEIDALARLRDVYRRGGQALLAEQLAQMLHSEPDLRALLRELRIPQPARPRLYPAAGLA